MNWTFKSLIDTRADEEAERVFLIDPELQKELTFKDLQHYCQQLTAHFCQQGIAPGTKIAFLLNNGYWTTVLFFAVMYSGNVIVPLNAVASVENLAYAVNNAEADLVYFGDGQEDLLSRIRPKLRADVTMIKLDRSNGFDVLEKQFSNDLKFELDPHQPAMIMHTSGTTSRPKGVVLTHDNMIAGGENVMRAHNLTRDDRVLSSLPLYHINGQVVTIIAPLCSASSVVMPSKFSVSEFWKTAERYQCTWVNIVPTIAKYLLDSVQNDPAEFRNRNLQCLKFGRSASAALPQKTLEEFEQEFGIPMIETMGLTESAAPILANPMPPARRIAGSVGIPCGTDVRVTDDRDRQMSTGEEGEIVIRGRNVFSEYYKEPETTAASFTKDGWFLTGDLGYVDADGYFYVTGRKKELIIKGGENIAPREIDDVLYKHNAVLEAGSFGFPDEAYGQVVAAGVVLRSGHKCTEQDLIHFCIEHLGNFTAPTRIFFLNDLPKGPSGKIQRLEIPRMLKRDGALQN